MNCKPKRLSSYAQPNTVAHKTARQSLCGDTPQKQEGIIVPAEHSNKPTEDLQIEEVKDTPTNLDLHLQQVIQAMKSDLPVGRSVLAESETGEVAVVTGSIDLETERQ